jgi:Pyruvate/2-oxoacid:ferredoxin oxidoreductase gamma subunit
MESTFTTPTSANTVMLGLAAEIEAVEEEEVKITIAKSYYRYSIERRCSRRARREREVADYRYCIALALKLELELGH